MIIKDAEKRIRLNDKEYHCALDITMDFIGGKWKTVIIWYLRHEPRRFSALKKVIPDITEKMLSIQLRALEQSGLLERTVLSEKPLVVQYGLTSLGKSTIPAVEALAAWGRQIGSAQGEMVDVVR